MKNKKYYWINFIIHVVYGLIVIVSTGYSFGNMHGKWSDLLVYSAIIFAIPVPIITIIILIVKCTKNRPQEQDGAKFSLDILLCIVSAVTGWFLPLAATLCFSTLFL
jgi:hypothetical protein